jgi:hypothetical protein
MQDRLSTGRALLPRAAPAETLTRREPWIPGGTVPGWPGLRIGSGAAHNMRMHLSGAAPRRPPGVRRVRQPHTVGVSRQCETQLCKIRTDSHHYHPYIRWP